MLAGAQLRADWTFVVRYEDVVTSQQRLLVTASDSGISGLYTAVIGELQPYRKYRIEVFTVTQHGIPSCELQPVTAQTGEQKAPCVCVGMLCVTHLLTLMMEQFSLRRTRKLWQLVSMCSTALQL